MAEFKINASLFYIITATEAMYHNCIQKTIPNEEENQKMFGLSLFSQRNPGSLTKRSPYRRISYHSGMEI